jgi:malate synthase
LRGKGRDMSVEIHGPVDGRRATILTDDALAFVAALHERFAPRRRALLAARSERRARLAAGALPDFLDETAAVREADWTVAPAPADLDDRRVEITGPTDRKMVINALNSGARVFMADFEDANAPTWANMIDGQVNLVDAVRREIALTDGGRTYALGAAPATLVVRPRGWHLDEPRITVAGEPVAGALVDFGLYCFHNGHELLARGSGPYFYLPKLESHREARLWNDVFTFAHERLGIPHGTIRATVLIEHVLAAFEMDEILYELRDHAAGLNAGRWDYIFSVIKTFRHRDDVVLPDRAQVTMTVPFMRAYTELLVRTCHRRGAHAIGGMAAFIPSRRDPRVNDTAIPAVRADKEREAGDGFDGTWVAHPDLVAVAREQFDAVLGERPHQKARLRAEVSLKAGDLLDIRVPGGTVTAAGLRANVGVGLRYLAAWLGGQGAVAINNLMEDVATAEISRSQLWQWRTHDASLDDGRPVTAALVRAVLDEELAAAREQSGGAGRWDEARAVFEDVALADDLPEFLTVGAMPLLG